MSEQNKKKNPLGFNAVLVGSILCVVSAIAYGVMFSTIKYKEPLFDMNICILLVITAVVSLGMLFTAKTKVYSSVPLCIGSGISLLMFLKMMIWPISDTAYGIEPFPQMSALITCMVAFVITFVIAEISLYTKKAN